MLRLRAESHFASAKGADDVQEFQNKTPDSQSAKQGFISSENFKSGENTLKIVKKKKSNLRSRHLMQNWSLSEVQVPPLLRH